MAISEINNKFDGISDDILQNCIIKITIEYEKENENEMVRYLENIYQGNAFGGNGTQALIGPSNFVNVKLASTLDSLSSSNIPLVSYGATSSELGHKNNFPSFIRTCPSASFQAYNIAALIYSYFNWKKVTVFSSANSYGYDLLQEFEDSLGAFNLLVETKVSFWPGIEDLTDSINFALSSGSLNHVFVFLMESSDAGRLLEQGYEMGLFTEGTQIVGTDQLLSPDTWMAMSETADIPRLMKGCIAVSHTTSIVRKQQEFEDFVKRWRAQQNTIKVNADGSTVCDQRKDDAGNQYLYQGLVGSTMVCTGLNFSSFASDGSDISDLALFAYDAVYAVAYALQEQSNLTGAALYDSIVNQDAFDGISGVIQFNSDGDGNEYFTRGDRETDLSYAILNFHPSYYNATDPTSSDPVRTIGVWIFDENRFVPCNKETDTKCSDWVFNTGDNSRPMGEAVVVEVQMPKIVRTGLLIGGCFSLAVAFFITMYLLAHAKSRLIRASQPGMLLLILLGAAIASIRVIVATLDITDVTCVAGKWMGHLAFGLVFGALILRAWRVGKLMKSGLQRTTVRLSDVQRILAIGMALLCGYLIMDTYVGQPHRSYTSQNYSPAVIHHLVKCDNTLPVVTYVLYGLEFIALAFGARICWATKDLPDAVNDSKYIAICKYIHCLF